MRISLELRSGYQYSYRIETQFKATDEHISMDITKSEDNVIKPQPQSCLFSSIPGELRNRIMRLTLEPETAVVVRRTQVSSSRFHCSLRLAGQQLLKVCRQLRSEFASIFWLETMFHIGEWNLDPPALDTLVNLIGPAASVMKQIRISHPITTLADSGRDKDDIVDLRLTKVDSGIVCEGLPHTVRGGNEVLCMCKFQTLVPTKATGGVLDWVQEYAKILSMHQQAGGAPEDSFHCWICAGRVWWHDCVL